MTEVTEATITAIETLHTLALAHDELAFAHLCTAALNGEPWATERLVTTLADIERGRMSMETTRLIVAGDTIEAMMLRFIRATDTTRPDVAEVFARRSGR